MRNILPASHNVDQLDQAIPQSSGSRAATGRPATGVRARVPVAVAPVRDRAAKAKGGLMALPVISGLCCLGVILFLLAATIVLALIPIYTSNRSVSPTSQSEIIEDDIIIENGTISDDGTLNSDQTRALQDAIQQQLNSDPSTSDATVSVLSAVTSPTTRRKRQSGIARKIRARIRIVFRRRGSFRTKVLLIIRRFVITSVLASKIQAAAKTTTTATTAGTTLTTTTLLTTTTKANSTGNSSRVLVRRSLKEGGAPAGVVYIDAHRIAGVTGDVSSVSFYVDQTCASATVEFGAFELLSRDVGTNTAELILKERSGELKINDKDNLKPFMSLITIELCTGNALEDASGDGCQGHQFPVLAHQYLGIRSGSCRLGFAKPADDPVFATTWTVENSFNPFIEPAKKAKYVPAQYTILQTIVVNSKVSAEADRVKEKTVGTTNGPRVLFLGSYSPRRCGLATFLEDLTNSYPGAYDVVAVDEQTPEAAERQYPGQVIQRLNQGDRDAYYALADFINKEPYDVVNIQHEYALYGGLLGEYVLALMSSIRKPVVTTMHTIAPDPNPMYVSVTRAVCALSTRVVVLAEVGRQLLIDVYGIDENKIVVVPHGVPDVPYLKSLDQAKKKLGFDSKAPLISTFGLLNRNKNIQLALQAMKQIVETVPDAMYLVIGQTHPAIQSYEGESYRHELEGNASALGLAHNVEFINRFVNDAELIDYLVASDVYLTPYAREDQYVSGTLSWAVGLGKAVVSTPYLYAKELLADGRGFLVPFEDSNALCSTVTQIIQNNRIRNEARRHAYEYGRDMTWAVVTRRLESLFRELQISN